MTNPSPVLACRKMLMSEESLIMKGLIIVAAPDM